MNAKYNKGYQLPEELKRVMDLASELNARVNELITSEEKRLVDADWETVPSVRIMTRPLLHATDAVVDVMDDLFKYASHLIQTEMYEKNKKAPVKPIKQ